MPVQRALQTYTGDRLQLSGHSPHDAVRIVRRNDGQRVQTQTKIYVVTQFRMAQQAARIAGLANRVGEIVPRLKKASTRDQGRVFEVVASSR